MVYKIYAPLLAVCASAPVRYKVLWKVNDNQLAITLARKDLGDQGMLVRSRIMQYFEVSL